MSGLTENQVTELVGSMRNRARVAARMAPDGRGGCCDTAVAYSQAAAMLMVEAGISEDDLECASPT